MKPKLLIIGDSLSTADPRWPGQHFSEKLPDFEVINFAVPGPSPTLLGVQLFEGLMYKPDCVAIGCPNPARINFLDDELTNMNQRNPDRLYRWYTNSHPTKPTDRQRTVYTGVARTVDRELWDIEGYFIIRSLILTLKDRNIPYVYALGDMGRSLKKYHPHTSILHSYYRKLLREFEPNCIPAEVDLEAHPVQHESNPIFHVIDQEWQQRYADHIKQILAKQMLDKWPQLM